MNWKELEKTYNNEIDKLSESNKRIRKLYTEGLCNYILEYLNKYNIPLM